MNASQWQWQWHSRHQRHQVLAFLCIVFLTFISTWIPCATAQDQVLFDLSDVSVSSLGHSRRLDASEARYEYSRRIFNTTAIQYDPSLELFYDPPSNHSSPTALGVFVWSNNPAMKFYWNDTSDPPHTKEVVPTLDSPYADINHPYIQLDTPFKASRVRKLKLVGIVTDEEGVMYRTKLFSLYYYVEAGARPLSYGYFVPGIESGGYFIQIGLEMVASARAQAAGSQEFADFSTYLGLGTYDTQIQAVHLPSIDQDLNGFEGGFPFDGVMRHFGILIPYHSGSRFFGKVVKVDLEQMSNASRCEKRYVIEKMDKNRNIVFKYSPYISSLEDACIHVLDLESMHPLAIGYRRGFLGFPYGYLSPGDEGLLVRLDLENFGLAHTKMIDLTLLSNTYGGYSGGFADGRIACFNPFRTYSGVVGGIRSKLPVDANNIRPYFNSIMVCVNETAWEWNPLTDSLEALASQVRTLDFSTIEDNLRGFSDAIRVGRYAYICPLSSTDTTYTSKLIRINLGVKNIIETLDATMAANGNIRKITNILDLSKVNPNLKGYSGMYTAGRYLVLVPYRNSYEPRNGQRGHGLLVRLNMNDFSLTGVEYIDLSNTTRKQIPSFADTNLRGFSFGFASGQYGVLVPFFNADFDGKIARFLTHGDLTANLQELDVMIDRRRRNVYKGYRGGFASLWQGVAN